MKGFIPIDIPTKKYIKAFIIHRHGEKPILSRESLIGSKLEDLLYHFTNEQKNQFNSKYNTSIRIYISLRTFKRRGAALNHTNIKNFNLFVEKYIKELFHFLMDDAVAAFPSFESNIDRIRIILGIFEDDWSTDSMKKEYYRHRKQKGLDLFYNKSFATSVPSMPLQNFAF